MRERDFADEEREHDPFVVKDTLGLVRVGQSGSISTREVNEGGSSPWRRLSTKLTEADDVVAVDGTLGSALIVFTRDETSACDGPATPSIHAVFAPVEPDTEGGVERSYDLAVGECDRELGQFWTGAIGPRSFVTAWVERVPSAKPGEARVSGISYRTIADDGVGELRHVARSADEMVDAGCDNRDRCYAVSLSRSDDGSQHIDVLAYP
jgi:hypothetical protein